MFPLNTESTGYYGSITAKGVLEWQLKHNVAPVDEINSLQGRRVGPATIAKLNEIYS
jgi:peptidoglycan hydrolase-like protein with peptidoglycan-binding domain